MRRLACGTQRGNQTCDLGLGSFGRQRNETTDASQQRLPIMSVNLKITPSLSLLSPYRCSLYKLDTLWYHRGPSAERHRSGRRDDHRERLPRL